MRNTKNSIFTSLISLLLCISMLLGTTFAWFTDMVSSDGNIIQSGNLEAQMFYSEDFLAADDAAWKDASNKAVFTQQNWEPGYTDLKYVKIHNGGSLNFKWKLTVEADGPVTDLADVIDVYYVNPANNEITSLAGLESVGTLTEVMSKKTNSTGKLEPGQSAILAIAFHMQESADNNYQDKYLCENGFSLKLLAAQDVGESDSFGDNYDDEADWDEGSKNFTASAPLNNIPIIYGNTVATINIGGTDGKSAVIPSGVKVAEGATSLDLAINAVDGNDNLTLDNGATATNMDVHINGIAADNTQPMIVNLGAILAPGLDATELKLYHTENSTPIQMTRVASADDFSIHNQYTYNAETGEVSIYVATFSVFSAVQTSADVWDGESDTTWYNENDTEFTLTTAEQFAGFRDLVDGGNTFAGKTVKLGADIDLADKQFDPIGNGYDHLDGQVFKGIFDGENHTIYNLAQNGWELGYSYGTMGGGLFASIKDSTIKNIAISGANIVMECVDMGVLVGYAQGTCHFENIVITNSKLANYQRYSGGVVGEVSYGPYGTDISKGYSHSFKNITVDSTVKLSSLWGDFDNANGGVIGGKWGDATVKMENVVVAAELDVFSDVTAAYQWYAYRRCGMLIGHTEQNSPKKALNAAAEFLTCENVNVYYGDWVNYTYYKFADQDSATGQRYPWVRAEAGEHNAAFSNPRYGVPTHYDVKVSDLTEEALKEVATDYTPIVFGQLYGGGQGVYGTNEHVGVEIQNLGASKTIYIYNNLDWQNLKLQCYFKNGNDTWTTNIDGISMDGMITTVDDVYKVTIPYYAHGIKVTADDGNNVEYILSDLTDGHTYKVDGNALNVAAVNGTFYETLEEAIANANGGTVTLVNNVVLEETIVIDNADVTLNLNGKTISVADNAEIVEVLLVKNNANVVITGNGKMHAKGTGEDVEHVEVISAIDSATVVIKNGTFISEGCTAVYATRGATVSIYGGHYEAKEIFDGRYFTLDVNEAEGNRGTIVVYGGSYVNFDPANHTTDGENYTNKLAGGCYSSNDNDGDGIYTVVANHNFVDNECVCGASQVEAEKWDKLTSGSALNIGDKVVFVYEDGKMGLSAFSNTNTIYGIGSAYTNVPDGIMVFDVVEGSTDGTFAFKNGDNYLNWSSENSLSTSPTLSANTSWAVSVDKNGNTIVKNGKDDTRTIQWNKTSPRFACYTSSQTAISIYVKINYVNIVCPDDHHIYMVIDQKDATCGTTGYTIEKCLVCDTEARTDIQALEHDYTGTNPYICANNCGVHNLPEAGSTITIQEALWVAETLANDKETSAKYVITGVIDDEDDPSLTGATTITIDGYSIYITNIHNVDGTIRYDKFVSQPQNGDTITVSAKIAKNDSGEAQLHETRLANHTDSDENYTCDICGGSIESGSEEPDPIEPTVPTWKKTDLANIKDTDIVVIVWTTSGGKSYAVSNDKGTSSAPTAVEVTISGDQLTGDITDNIKWNISNTNGNLTIYPNGKTATWLYCTNDNNGVRVGTNSNKVFTIDATSGYLKNTGTSRYLGVYTTNPDVRCYTSTTTNIAEQTLAFYVYGGSETPACEHTNTTTTTVDATCTEAGSKTVTCDDCGETVSTEEIKALGHKYVDGTCSACGEAENAGGETPAEPETLATFEFGANESATHKDGSTEETTYSETQGDYSLSISNASKMYPASYDAKGNSCIKLGTSNKIGSFTFTVAEDVTKVVIYVAQYKANTTKISVNGTSYTITTASDNGEYTAIEIDTTTTKTVTFTTESGGYRCMINTIEFYGTKQ